MSYCATRGFAVAEITDSVGSTEPELAEFWYPQPKEAIVRTAVAERRTISEFFKRNVPPLTNNVSSDRTHVLSSNFTKKDAG